MCIWVGCGGAGAESVLAHVAFSFGPALCQGGDPSSVSAVTLAQGHATVYCWRNPMGVQTHNKPLLGFTASWPTHCEHRMLPYAKPKDWSS